MTATDGYTCACCGDTHRDVPFAWHVPAPAQWSERYEGREDCVLDAELCMIEERDFFVRGIVEIPVVDAGEAFHWGVWVSLSESNFDRTVELWEREGRESEPAMFGWLSVELPGYQPSTINLKTNVHTQPVGNRPLVELEPTDHPLAVEQREGITLARVHELAALMMRG
jgi:hypothetical protein